MAKAGSKRSSRSQAKGVPSKNGRRRSKVFRVRSVAVKGVSPVHRGTQVESIKFARGRRRLGDALLVLANNPDVVGVSFKQL